VNNAGILKVGEISYLMSEEMWDMIINVNLKGTHLCCKYVVPHMIKNGYGKIVNTGSTAGRTEFAMGNAYGTAKSAVHAYTHILAMELAQYKINVNCVAPGNVNTAQRKSGNDAFAQRYGVDPKDAYKAQLEKTTLLQREVEAVDISNAVLFLVSEDSKNIDGHIFYVQGGQ
jgi:NAD(P)-dependent dehydrogenase (short-subunit alcohol dehydrogenase family)